MSEDTVHLHKTYEETFCGQDASHIPMTYVTSEVTCEQCLTKLQEVYKTLNGEREAATAECEELALKFQEAEKAMAVVDMEVAQLEEAHRTAMAEKYATRDEAHKARLELMQKGSLALGDKLRAESAIEALPTI
jgi:predicted nuclease with TOPRIM domain